MQSKERAKLIFSAEKIRKSFIKQVVNLCATLMTLYRSFMCFLSFKNQCELFNLPPLPCHRLFRYVSEMALSSCKNNMLASPGTGSINKEFSDHQLPESPYDMLARLFWIGVSLLESDYEHEFLLAIKLIGKVSVGVSKQFTISSQECYWNNPVGYTWTNLHKKEPEEPL